MNIIKSILGRIRVFLVTIVLAIILVLAVAVALPVVVITLPLVGLFAPMSWFDTDSLVQEIPADSPIMD